MHFDSYRWQDYVQNRYRRGLDLAMSGMFAIAFLAGAFLQSADHRGFTPAADNFTLRTAQIRALSDCDA